MAHYEIPINWMSCKYYSVEAENLEEAVTKAIKQFLSEPDDNYLSDSFEIDPNLFDETDEEVDMLKVYNNI